MARQPAIRIRPLPSSVGFALQLLGNTVDFQQPDPAFSDERGGPIQHIGRVEPPGAPQRALSDYQHAPANRLEPGNHLAVPGHVGIQLEMRAPSGPYCI